VALGRFGALRLASTRPNVWSQKWNYEAKTSLQHLISRLTSRLIVSWQISQRTSSVGAQNTLTISLQNTVGIQTVSGGQISGAITIIGLSGVFATKERKKEKRVCRTSL